MTARRCYIPLQYMRQCRPHYNRPWIPKIQLRAVMRAIFPLPQKPTKLSIRFDRTLTVLRQRTATTSWVVVPWNVRSTVALVSGSAIFLLAESTSSRQPPAPQTQELRILAESEKELHYNIRDEIRGAPPFHKFYKYVTYYIQLSIIEPVATCVRFLHLALLFLPVVVSMPVIWIGPQRHEYNGERAGTIWWYRFLVKSMERAGPTFIKLGQWAASRTDIFPLQMCSIMSTLHSNVAAHPLSQTREIIEEAFDGRPFQSIFLEFEETPLGVGAIAQVYRAKLNPDLLPSVQTSSPGGPGLLKNSAQDLLNRVETLVNPRPSQVPSGWVAIKVLHPHVDRLIHRDLRIMKIFSVLINSIPTLEWLSLPDEVDKFGEMMRLQLDLRIEARNLAKFLHNFEDRNTVTFPTPYIDYTTRQVLVEEFVHGVPLQNFLEFGGGVYQKQLADMGLDAFLRMLLIDNFAHADLHPGNILVRFYRPVATPIMAQLRVSKSSQPHPSTDISNNSNAFEATDEALSRLYPMKGDPQAWQTTLASLSAEGFKTQLVFIDTGLVTELSPINRQNFLDLFTAVAEFDGYRAGELMVERCRQPDAVIDKDIFCLRMQHLVLGVKGKTFTLGEIKIADILSEVLSLIRSHHVRLEGDFINVVVSILLLEGIGRRLDPDIDIFKSSLPIMRQIGARKGHEMLNTDVSMLKIWLGLELRTILSSSVREEDLDSSFLMKHLWNE
ncbi:hypothetical protein TWF696_005204 [Orbilia brochopaga]|uniref:ABC1 atypical kinase-like domain-containing protein n=1 Tax=Orbilia brochopaga TaxID=3140254 RepID=A0AAV9V0C9_9PEZI